MKIGILKETKVPIDRRVPLAPKQVLKLTEQYPQHQFIVQSSDIRAIRDEEYFTNAIDVRPDVDDCDFLLAVKELKVETIMPEKTYLFFSHTAKQQPYNRKLLQELAVKKTTLIDYEYLVDDRGFRVIAFGHWAGVVGAYNGLRGYGLKTQNFRLKASEACSDLAELEEELKTVQFNKPIKIIVTGEGRVAGGAVHILKKAGIRPVSSREFLNQSFNSTVFCQIGPAEYTRHQTGDAFNFEHFIANPDEYTSTFKPYTHTADIFIASHFWDKRSPVFFTPEDIKSHNFKLKVIADISCDIGGPIPTTLRSSTIDEPYYDIDPIRLQEEKPFGTNTITVMAVDNLPGALPRESSADFGEKLVNIVFPEFFKYEFDSRLIMGATILKDGKLTEKFAYLQDFLDGK